MGSEMCIRDRPNVSHELVDAMTYAGRALRVVRINNDLEKLREAQLRNSVEWVKGKVGSVLADVTKEGGNKTIGFLIGRGKKNLTLKIYAPEDHIFHSADIPNTA